MRTILIALCAVIASNLLVQPSAAQQEKRASNPEHALKFRLDESLKQTSDSWGDCFASKDGKTLYLHILKWPESGTIAISDMSVAASSAVYLANGKDAKFKLDGGTLTFTLPAKPVNEYDTVIKVTLKDSIHPKVSSATESKSARDAWDSLAGRFSKRPEFAFVENDLALPNVLIYGDSISIGYTQRVREKMRGKANVYRIYANGSDSKALIPKMKKMHGVMTDSELDHPWTFKWDVIHFNVGLHDIKYLSGKKLDKENGKQVSSIEDYKNNLSNIVAYLKKLAPDSKLVFATTTPVPEGAQGRFAGDAKKYNVAAKEVIGKFPDIAINDLYELTMPNLQQWCIKPGNVHFGDPGKNAQGDQVAKVILEMLAKSKKAQ